jgi:16S rRNA (uracil1498-N3)-methyltransferase
MDIFYSNIVKNNKIELPKSESHHCIAVKRKRINDKVKIVDGKGQTYIASISIANKNNVVLDIESKKKSSQPNNNLHLIISPTKSHDRIDWIVEKATEIGVEEISFALCHRTERKKINIDRVKRITISALKQSGQAYLPKINNLQKIKDILESSKAEQKYIAHLEDEAQVHLRSVYRKGKSSCVLIGPEGDFTKDEIDLSEKYNFTSVTLGENTLRTETAGIYVSSLVNILND